jgi:hypothetical protein
MGSRVKVRVKVRLEIQEILRIKIQNFRIKRIQKVQKFKFKILKNSNSELLARN